MHADNRGPDTQTCSSKGAEGIKDIESIQRELLPETSHPSLPTIVHTSGLASSWVKLFFREHRILLDTVTDQQDRWKSVGELQDTCSPDEGC